MSNPMTMVPSVAGGAPPLNLEGASPADLRELCKGLYSDLSFLAGIVPERCGPTVSSGITAAFAGLAGALDGGLGENNKIGPITINTAVAIGAAAAALAAPTANWREFGAAVARGVGAPLIYNWARGGTQTYAMNKKLKAASAPTATT